MAAQPLHSTIFDYVRASISAGKYSTGQRLPSDGQLAKQFGTSRPTVMRAMRDLQTEGFIKRRTGSGSYVCGVPTRSATKQFGLLIPGLGTTEIFELICGEIVRLAHVHDYGVLWGGSARSRRDDEMSRGHAEEFCEQFIQQKVNGVFFAPFEFSAEKERDNERIATRLRDEGIPVVLIDRDLRAFPSRSDFDLVSTDNFTGGYLLAEHLIKLGCRHIAFIARPGSAPSVDIRIAGAREALLRHHIPMRPDWVAWGDPSDMKFVRKLTAGMLFDAFICANDYTAAVMLRALEQRKLHVPGQVRVVGFDDIRYATLLGVPLTTIHQPCREIAITAFHTMMRRIAQPESPPYSALLAPRLVVRESCGAYPPSQPPRQAH